MTATKKVSDLNGDDLALWVARAAGYEITQLGGNGGLFVCSPDGSDLGGYIGNDFTPQFAPHESWSQGGPLIPGGFVEYKGIGDHCEFVFCDGPVSGRGIGETLLISAMRAVVASKFGDTVEEVVA